MKHYYIAFLLCLFSFTAPAQNPFWEIWFDGNNAHQNLISIDTVNYKRNDWQIGKPAKTVITAFSAPNAIVTDTTHPYTPFDTSVFTLKLPAVTYTTPSHAGPLYYFSFYYRLHKDSADKAMVTLSLDSGKTWLNLADTLPPMLSWYNGDSSDFDTSTQFGKYSLSVDMNYGMTHIQDTLMFRFTFMSDSNNFGKDGWLIDNMEMRYFFEDVAKLNYNADLISLYPNPSGSYVYIQRKTKERRNEQVDITDMKGAIVYQTTALPASGQLQHHLPAGQYLLKYTAGDSYTVRKLVVQ